MISVEIVQCFNGEERRIRRTARTNSGARRGIRACASGNGWGVKLRGTVEALTAIGAEQNAYGQWVFDADPKSDRFVDCTVVEK